MEIRVYYEDTDANGIVYHPNYIKYCDRARSEYFFRYGLRLKEGNSYLVIRSLDVKYYKPAVLGDILLVTNKIESIQRASISVYHEILKKDSGEKLFSMKITLVYLRKGVPSMLPASYVELFHKFNDGLI